MNPEQLWETTMDPEKRTLIQITEEDEAAAEKILKILYGRQCITKESFYKRKRSLC